MVLGHRVNTLLQTEPKSAINIVDYRIPVLKKAILKSLTWNISQSGCMNSPRKTVLYATDAMCIVCDAGSLGQKSSEALTTAVLFELNPKRKAKEI